MTPLRRRMLEDMGIRNLAANTQLCYVNQVAAFARYFDRSPEQLGPEEVRIYQNYLVATSISRPAVSAQPHAMARGRSAARTSARPHSAAR